MSKKVTILLGRRNVDGESLDFETVKESWNQYQAEDGTLLKFKTVISDVVRLNKYQPDGKPLYVVKSTNILESDVPDHLFSKPRKKEERN